MAAGTWIRKIDSHEMSSVRRPPTPGPRAAPIVPARAQAWRRPLGTRDGWQQLERSADGRSSADRLNAAGGEEQLDPTGDATGWLPHTTRAALTGLRHKGFVLDRDKRQDGTTVYRISSAPAASSPSKAG